MGAKIVENITGLLLEIIGYLTSSIYLIVILSLLIKDNYHFEIPSILQNELILLILLYAFGYLVRSISISISTLSIFNLKKKISEELNQKEAFNKVHEMIGNKLDIDIELDFNEVRNICLGKYPEISNKVYLFMFRSSLFFDLFVINTIILLIVCFDSIFLKVLFSYDITNLVLLALLAIVLYPLLKARKRFFKISYKIPISNYLSKNLS